MKHTDFQEVFRNVKPTQESIFKAVQNNTDKEVIQEMIIAYKRQVEPLKDGGWFDIGNSKIVYKTYGWGYNIEIYLTPKGNLIKKNYGVMNSTAELITKEILEELIGKQNLLDTNSEEF